LLWLAEKKEVKLGKQRLAKTGSFLLI